MTVHTCRPGHPGILADDCERCAEHAASPLLLDLDAQKTEELWAKMVDVERGGVGGYATGAEAKAASKFYTLAIWLERNLGINPWQALPAVRAGSMVRL